MNPEMRDLHGVTLTIGIQAKMSGGYADSGRPDYMVHELVEVVGFGRTRVEVKLLSKDYADRPTLRVLPRTLVLEEEGKPQRPLVNDTPIAGRRRD